MSSLNRIWLGTIKTSTVPVQGKKQMTIHEDCLEASFHIHIIIVVQFNFGKDFIFSVLLTQRQPNSI